MSRLSTELIKPSNYVKLKNQLVEKCESANFENFESEMKQNQETVLQHKFNIENLRRKVAELQVGDDSEKERREFRNISVEEVQTILEKHVCDKKKKLNAMKHTTQKLEESSEELRLQHHILQKEKGSCPDPYKQKDKDKESRMVVNRLEKTKLKCCELENCFWIYCTVKHHLQDEALSFQPRIDGLETETHKQTQVLKDLLDIKENAIMNKEAEKAELQLQEEKVYRNYKEKERILSRYKKRTEMEKQAQRANLGRSDLNTEAQATAEEEKEEDDDEELSVFRKAFQRIKEATGIISTQEFANRFASQRETQESLEKMKLENETTLVELKESIQNLQAEFQNINNTREKEIACEQQLLQNCEREMKLSQERCSASKDQLDVYTGTLNKIKAEVQHLINKLEHISLDISPMPSPSSLLQQLSEIHMKMTLLKKDLRGKDTAALLIEMKEEEFLTNMIKNQPQDNIRIPFHDDQKDASDDEHYSSDDGDEVVTRATLKYQSQQMIDPKNQRKNRRKKKDK